DGRGPGARTFERDLAEVHLIRREVRVGRIVPVEAPNRWVAKQHAPAPIRLQPVLVGIDDGGGRFADALERRVGVGFEVVRQQEVAAVRGVGVNPEVVAAAQVDYGREWVYGTGSRRAQRGDNRPDVAGAAPALEGVDIHAAATVTGDRFERPSGHAGHALVRVMRLRRREDRLAWME